MGEVDAANNRMFGIASTLVGACLWGLSGTCAQYLLANYAISSLFITVVRMVGSGSIFLAIILVRYRWVLRDIFKRRRARRRLVLFGVFGLFASQITYVITVGYTNAGTATVLQCTSIAMIALVTCAIARRKPHVAELVGVLLATLAVFVIATQGDVGALRLPAAGLLWGLLSAFAAVGYSMLPQSLYPRWGSFAVVGSGMLVGGVVATLLWGLAFAFPQIDTLVSAGNPCGSALLPQLDATGFAVFAVIVIFGTFGAYFLFLNGISIVGAVQGSQLGAIEPVSATVFSALITQTAFSLFDWVGLILMVATILAVSAAGKRREP